MTDSDELSQRFETDLRAGVIDSVQGFLENLDCEVDIGRIAQLIGIEIQFRRLSGQQSEIEDYFDSFPHLNEFINEPTLARSLLNETAVVETDLVEYEGSLTNSRPLIQVGDSIDDFELLAELGKGSFATVFLARQTSMQRLVALKVSSDHGLEAQTLAQLDHPHIVRVYDQRKVQQHNLQLLYMQYLDGGTLLDVLEKSLDAQSGELNGSFFVNAVDQAVIARGGSPSYESPIRKAYMESNWEQTIARIGYHLSLALDYAHRMGVLHRDIKPANVLIGNDCSVKLADFNISSADTVIGESKFGGSLAYMSPEQIRAFSSEDNFSPNQLNGQSDLYSLGVMLYQLLRGELPFFAMSKSRSPGGLTNMISERTQSIERIDASLINRSPILRIALVRSLQPAIERRVGTAKELANQFKIALDPEVENFLFPGRKHWSILLHRHFYFACIAVSLIFNALAAIFVFNFNLLDSVPEPFHGRFWNVQAIINGIVFPLAFVIFYFLTKSVAKTIQQCFGPSAPTDESVGLAMDQTLSAGHIQAVICGSLWLVAGFIYPIVLTRMGCELTRSDWLDFVASHVLAGIAITAQTFFVTTYLSLRIWLPVLIQKTLTTTVIKRIVSGLNRIIRLTPVYQMLAISVPLLAMALLILFGEVMTGSKFPLTVISLFGLLTIPVVLWGGNHVHAICERLLVVFRGNR
ncbi:MAG: serine/threonine-protein kinase [Planctomycetota bacterium]